MSANNLITIRSDPFLPQDAQTLSERHAFNPTKLFINLDAVASNIKNLKEYAAGRLFMTVIKANAYGNGFLPIAETARKVGTDWFGVAMLEEALILREHGFTEPILVLGITTGQKAAEAALKNNIHLTLCTKQGADALHAAAEQLKTQAPVHLKIDTGMNRIGLYPSAIAPFIQYLRQYCPRIEIEGAFSHLASPDETDTSQTTSQLERFKSALTRIDNAGIQLSLRHCSGSAGIINWPESWYDMVRSGISLYGVYPSEHARHDVHLQEAMTLKTEIVMLKTVKAGEKISYGGTYSPAQDTRIAVLPIGYADGYPRLLSNKGDVLIHGLRAPVVGRVCMDMTMVDVSGIHDAATGDEVVLIGQQGTEEILSEEIAAKAQTIPHEIMCGITARVPRYFTCTDCPQNH